MRPCIPSLLMTHQSEHDRTLPANHACHLHRRRIDPALAQRFGTPVYVYDAAPIARRIGLLKQFDAIRYAQKACSNLAILDLMRRHGVRRRRRERRRDSPRAGGRLQAGPATAPARDRLHRRPLRPRSARRWSSSTTCMSIAARPT